MSEQADQRADPAARVHPCVKRTWCILPTDHHGACGEIPGAKHEPADFGPRVKK